MDNDIDDCKFILVIAWIDWVPLTDYRIRCWCEAQGFDYLGVDSGRVAWCSEFNTYLRGAVGIGHTDGGERFLISEDDIW